MFCYCLYCEPGKSQLVRLALQAVRPCRTISPRQTLHTWRKGAMVDLERDLFPGYLFVYSETTWRLDEFRQIQEVVYCLRTTDRKIELQGDDEQFALTLLQTDGVIGKTKVYQEGQWIRLHDGVFAGLKTTILKVDRRSHCIQIEIPFANRRIKTWVEYEMIEPEDEETT